MMELKIWWIHQDSLENFLNVFSNNLKFLDFLWPIKSIRKVLQHIFPKLDRHRSHKCGLRKQHLRWCPIQSSWVSRAPILVSLFLHI